MATTAIFTCAYQWPGPDQRVHQCAAVFDSAVGDRAPDLTRPPSDAVTPEGPPNPDYRAAGTGNFAIACDSILIDRQAPQLTLRSIPSSATVGVPVLFEVSTPEPEAGGAGLAGEPNWSFGDGTSGPPEIVEKPTATGAGVAHTFTQPGTYAVTVTWLDAAGNTGAAAIMLPVRAVDPSKLVSYTAAREFELPRSRRVTVVLTVTAREPGSVNIAVARGKTTVARAQRRFLVAGTRTFRVRLDAPARPGAHTIKLKFGTAGQPSTSVTKSRSFRVVRRLR